MIRISAQELAALGPCSAEHVRPHEVLVSDAAMETCGLDGVEFELIGDVPLTGVSKAVRLHKAAWS